MILYFRWFRSWLKLWAYFISYKILYSDHPLVLLTALHYLHRVIPVLLVQKLPKPAPWCSRNIQTCARPNLCPRYSSTWRYLQHLSVCLFLYTLTNHVVLPTWSSSCLFTYHRLYTLLYHVPFPWYQLCSLLQSMMSATATSTAYPSIVPQLLIN